MPLDSLNEANMFEQILVTMYSRYGNFSM